MSRYYPGNSGVQRTNTERTLLVLTMLIAIVHVSPLVFEHIDAASSNDDWTQIFAFQAYLADQLSTFGALPERSHILGGGFPIPGHPEYPILSPVIAPVFLFGPVLGVRLAAAIYYLLGVFGMWAWLRHRRFDPAVCLYGTVVYATCGWFVAIMVSGNFPQIYYMWLPLWLWLIIPHTADAPRLDLRVIAGAVLAAIALTDGHLNTVCTLLVVAFWALLSGGRALQRAILFAILTAGLAAFKLAPTIALLSVEDRSVDTYGTATLETATFSLGLFTDTTGRPDGFPMGWVPWLVCLPALLKIRQAEVLRWLSVFVVAALLWLGPKAPVDIFFWLSRLPVMRSIDAPSKYFVFFLGFAAIGLGCHSLMLLPKALRQKAAIAVALASSAPLLWDGSPELTRPFDRMDVATKTPTFLPYEPVDTAYFVSDDWTGKSTDRPDLYFFYRAGIPLLRWEDNFQLESHIIPSQEVLMDGTIKPNPDAQPLAALFTLTTAQIDSKTTTGTSQEMDVAHLSANRITVRIPTKEEKTRLVINQVADPGWQCSGGTIVSDRPRLELHLPPNSEIVDCKYASAPLRTGGAITALTMLFLLGCTWLQRRRNA